MSKLCYTPEHCADERVQPSHKPERKEPAKYPVILSMDILENAYAKLIIPNKIPSAIESGRRRKDGKSAFHLLSYQANFLLIIF